MLMFQKYSYKPPMREPFAGIVAKIQKSSIPIISIDIPSGVLYELMNCSFSDVSYANT